jgi:hypothetical protein
MDPAAAHGDIFWDKFTLLPYAIAIVRTATR